MRDLDQELQKLIDFANENDSIRGMVLQGSYINKNAPVDVFSDLDPLFYVTDVNEFINEFSWKDQFGEVVSYFHDEWDSKDNLKAYTRLTLFKDGFKLDFGFQDVKLAKYANDMELYKVYVDKDDFIPQPEVTDDSKFYVKKPTEEEFHKQLEDFFFDSSYVVKTIYREELFFQKEMEGILHSKIIHLLNWYIGMQHDFKINLGHTGRYFKKHLTKVEWEMIERTYCGPCVDSSIRALYKSFDLVRYLGNKIADKLGYRYLDKMDNDMLEYCEMLINKYIK